MNNRSGNILLYVLIAILLFAALSFALMRMGGGDNSAGGSLTNDKANLRAGEIIDYGTAAHSTVEQMRTLMNVLPTEFSFMKPGDPAYTTPPHTAKVFHPAGGGLNIFTDAPELYANGTSGRGWVAQQGTNVGWSETSASDILFTFVDVNKKICSAINNRLFKDSSIPDMTITVDAAFVHGGGDDVDLTAAVCPSCNGRPNLCVKDSGGTYAYYNVVLSR